MLLIVFAAAGFFAGTKYQQSLSPAAGNRQFAGANGIGPNGARAGATGQRRTGGGQVIGSITSEDANSITVSMVDGSSKIVLLTANTTFSKSTEGAKTDLAVGTKVGIFGSANPDGSVTAQNVSINPIMRITGQPTTASGTPAATK